MACRRAALHLRRCAALAETSMPSYSTSCSGGSSLAAAPVRLPSPSASALGPSVASAAVMRSHISTCAAHHLIWNATHVSGPTSTEALPTQNKSEM